MDNQWIAMTFPDFPRCDLLLACAHLAGPDLLLRVRGPRAERLDADAARAVQALRRDAALLP